LAANVRRPDEEQGEKLAACMDEKALFAGISPVTSVPETGDRAFIA
jgi:hypothetical protein